MIVLSIESIVEMRLKHIFIVFGEVPCYLHSRYLPFSMPLANPIICVSFVISNDLLVKSERNISVTFYKK